MREHSEDQLHTSVSDIHETSHSHDHEYEESCGCGHHHEEEEHHHHEHGKACSCGHHHREEGHHHREEGHHHHEHGESCSCGHHHEPASHPHVHGEMEESHAAEISHPKAVFLLENLGCAHCAAKMEAKINELPGVKAATITYATKQLRLDAEHPEKLLPQIQAICSSIESEVRVVDRELPGTVSAADHEKRKGLSEEKKELIYIVLGAILFVTGEVLEHMGVNTLAVLGVLVVGYVILGGKVLLEAARNISHGQVFDENFLMGLATLGAFAIGDYPEAVGVMLFYRIGEYFEERAVERSRGQIMEAVDLRPEVVNLIQHDQVQVIPAGEAKAGDVVLIRPGDRVPLDGVIIEGESRLDTSPITGEPVPVTVVKGDAITSGCVNTSGQLKMRVEKPLEESMVSRILDTVENAAASKPKIDRFITRFSRVYTPAVVGLALAVAILPSVITGEWNYWMYTAISFLVMSCPCALVLSVPLAFFSGIGSGSKRGILFKGGLSIEALSNVKAVVMDKTGTITEGNFKLQKVVSLGHYTEEELLAVCAGCEQHSTHPIAHSIVSAAGEKGLHLAEPGVLEELAGYGILALMPEGKVLCGNRKLMEANGVSVKTEEGEYGAEVFLAVDGVLEGYLVISDTIKADAKAAVGRLKSMGLHTVMLTGDSADSAKAIAQETGIDEIHAKLLPEEKLLHLQQVRKEKGAVMFVGDGINDAPVLAGADVGAAMGSGADAAIEAADAVFMTSSVESIPEAVAIARSTNRIAVQNVVFALTIKVAVMILGLLGHANMWLAVFADSGVAMLCVLNSIRILYKK